MDERPEISFHKTRLHRSPALGLGSDSALELWTKFLVVSGCISYADQFQLALAKTSKRPGDMFSATTFVITLISTTLAQARRPTFKGQ